MPIRSDDGRGRFAKRALVVLTVGQVVFGFVNLWLLAPVWMQLGHLLIADLMWIALVVTGVSALGDAHRVRPPT